MKKYKGKVAPTGVGDKYLPLIAKIIMEDQRSISRIALKSVVSQTTIRNWLAGKTKRPCRATVDNVLQACGFRMGVLPTYFRPSEELKPIKSYSWSQTEENRKS